MVAEKKKLILIRPLPDAGQATRCWPSQAKLTVFFFFFFFKLYFLTSSLSLFWHPDPKRWFVLGTLICHLLSLLSFQIKSLFPASGLDPLACCVASRAILGSVTTQVGGLPGFSDSHSISQQAALRWFHMVLMSRNIKLRLLNCAKLEKWCAGRIWSYGVLATRGCVRGALKSDTKSRWGGVSFSS